MGWLLFFVMTLSTLPLTGKAKNINWGAVVSTEDPGSRGTCHERYDFMWQLRRRLKRWRGPGAAGRKKIWQQRVDSKIAGYAFAEFLGVRTPKLHACLRHPDELERPYHQAAPEPMPCCAVLVFLCPSTGVLRWWRGSARASPPGGAWGSAHEFDKDGPRDGYDSDQIILLGVRGELLCPTYGEG